MREVAYGASECHSFSVAGNSRAAVRIVLA